MDQTFCKVGNASRTLILLIVTIFLASCASKKKYLEDDNEMIIQKFVPVTVKDAAGLDGCSFLLVKDSVTSFQPIDFSDSFEIRCALMFRTWHRSTFASSNNKTTTSLLPLASTRKRKQQPDVQIITTLLHHIDMVSWPTFLD